MLLQYKSCRVKPPGTSHVDRCQPLFWVMLWKTTKVTLPQLTAYRSFPVMLHPDCDMEHLVFVSGRSTVILWRKLKHMKVKVTALPKVRRSGSSKFSGGGCTYYESSHSDHYYLHRVIIISSTLSFSRWLIFGSRWCLLSKCIFPICLIYFH